jgi:hypothetical protein
MNQHDTSPRNRNSNIPLIPRPPLPPFPPAPDFPRPPPSVEAPRPVLPLDLLEFDPPPREVLPARFTAPLVAALFLLFFVSTLAWTFLGGPAQKVNYSGRLTFSCLLRCCREIFPGWAAFTCFELLVSVPQYWVNRAKLQNYRNTFPPFYPARVTV